MPNVGRPSKGCGNCRARKVKCDLKRPSCSQCVRTGKECHGYRDPLSVMFKNESDVVAKKAEKRYQVLAKQKASLSPATKSTGPSSPESDSSELWISDSTWCPESSHNQIVPYTRYPTPESITSSLVPSIEDQALGFFMANYVSKPSIVPRGQFEWVLELMAEQKPSETLQSSVRAATLAGFANATKDRVIMQQAQAAYGSALLTINNALRVPHLAVEDSTLVAVVMLGMYENFVMQDKRSIAAWAKHVDGACTLFKIRGPDQFKSDLARRIFHQFYGFALLVALETGTPVHPGMQELYEAMTPRSDYSLHGRQYTTRMINVMHRAIDLNKDKFADPEYTVTMGLRIDHDLDKIKAIMPPIWNYDTVRLETPSEHLYGDTFHLYIDPWIAQMWNNLNICRMYLYKTIRESLVRGMVQHNPPLFAEGRYTTIKNLAESVIMDTAMTTVASVPQIVGMIPFPDLKTAKRCASNPTLREPLPAAPQLYPPGTYLDNIHSTHMVHLIWPVYAAGQNDLIPPAMRQWLIDILHYIALRIGTRQAIVLADELKAIQQAQANFQPPVIEPIASSPEEVRVQLITGI